MAIPRNVTATLTPGTYELLLYAFTNIVKIPVQYVTSLTVSPPPPPTNVTSITSKVTKAPAVSITLLIAIIVIIVVIIIAIGVWLAIRRRK
ncbi:hypothetical protein [Vulcanisaeta sp. JCM 14467]|uniref:hypothetical protein n=1 Tax=Vulcanisaeta sp. JCM 14467 TaxID=1295370 RepID=UPI002092E597|nr:hypothetical protein [Vulcanisaeta sp. JCM 14467]